MYLKLCLYTNLHCNKPIKAKVTTELPISPAARSISWAMLLNLTILPMIQVTVIRYSPNIHFKGVTVPFFPVFSNTDQAFSASLNYLIHI